MDCLNQIHIHNSGSVLPTLITGTTFTVTGKSNHPTEHRDNLQNIEKEHTKNQAGYNLVTIQTKCIREETA